VTRPVRRLAIWLGPRHVADLDEVRSGKIRLTYTSDTLRDPGAGGLLLSASLPVRQAPYGLGETEPFLEGLLPEGEARTRIERRLQVQRGNTFALLRAIGRDCAGALAVLPPESEPVDDLHAADPLDDRELAAEIAALPESPLGVSTDVRLSLAGFQDKLVLVRRVDGGWARPRDGTPSTHILKPEPVRLPGLVPLEAFGLRVAEGLGLAVAAAEIIQVGSRPVLAVTRFDRRVVNGRVVRVHQEDLCQALAVSADRKYESDGGPGFTVIAACIRSVSTEPAADLDRLVRTMVLTVGIGNADGHARNLSLQYDGRARRLAPLYDVVPTAAVTARDGEALSRSLAMRVNGGDHLDDITGADLIAEAVSWRLASAAVRRTVEEVLQAFPGAVSRAAATIDLPAHVVESIRIRVAYLTETL
jgi:serine/threonine-protein kinase HipA